MANEVEGKYGDISGKYGDISGRDVSGKYGDISGLPLTEAHAVMVKDRLIDRIDYLEARIRQMERDLVGLAAGLDRRLRILEDRLQAAGNQT
ncbi:MAG: hypothetical protein ACXWID_01715 [Pyrinomonadaceae bacterium]